MSSCLLVVGILLAAQIAPPNERYGTGGQRQTGAADDSASNSDELVQVLAPPPADEAVPPAPPISSRSGGNPNFQSSTPPGGGNQRSPFSTPLTSPATDSPPPGFGGYQSRGQLPAAAAPTGTATSTVKPSALMRSMLTPPHGSRLTGHSITLAEIVAGAGSRAEQSQRIDAYWDLCSSVADYYLGLGEQQQLQQLRMTVSRVGPTWEQAEKELAVRIGTSERAAIASQYRLASLIGQPGAMPLPGDMPHCGNYFSHYDEIFSGRPLVEAQELSTLLPLRYAELKDAAAGVTRAEEWLNTIAAVRNENSDGTGTLRALELWALRRRAFVQIVRDYNRRIARYSELATPGEVSADRLVRILILREGDSTATRTSAPAAPFNRQSSNSADEPRSTFAGEWSPSSGDAAAAAAMRDDAVEQASVEAAEEPRQERSLLVNPQ